MSKFQLETIKEVMGFEDTEAKNLLALMDANNDHPDWSEWDYPEFRQHFLLVLEDAEA